MDQDRPSGSAENVASARALLTRRGILDDVYAERFVRTSKRIIMSRFASLPRGGRAISWIAARTRFFDELVSESLDAGIRQVVIVAAGYDARAWRLARPGVRFVEVDHPATQARKKALAPPSGPEYVAADLSVQRLPGVLESHIDASAPSVILCEGLTYYLTESDVRTLLTDAAEVLGAGSRLGTDCATNQKLPASTRIALAATKLLHRLTKEPLHFQLHPNEATDFLAASGWKATEVRTHADLHTKFLRDTDLPEPPSVGSFVCSATT